MQYLQELSLFGCPGLKGLNITAQWLLPDRSALGWFVSAFQATGRRTKDGFLSVTARQVSTSLGIGQTHLDRMANSAYSPRHYPITFQFRLTSVLAFGYTSVFRAHSKHIPDITAIDSVPKRITHLGIDWRSQFIPRALVQVD